MQRIEKLFNIAYGQMNQLLEDIVQSPLTSFTYSLNKTKRSSSGIVGEYLIPTFSIYTQQGKQFEKDLFFRRQSEGQRGFAQAHHYHFLESQHIPTPKLYGWFLDQECREVLCMEYLNEILDEETFLQDDFNCHSFLDLIARFSANKPTMDYLALVGRDMAYRGDYTREWKTWMLWSIYILDLVWEYAVGGRLNESLSRLCKQRPEAKLRLELIARQMITTLQTFDLGIIHGDFKPGNTAWRMKNKELVVFDLEDMMLDVRFYDAAMYLGAPQTLFKMDYGIKEDLVAFFIDRFSHYSGEKMIFDEFMREIQILWFTRTLNLWEWLPHHLSGPSYKDPEKGNNAQERCEKLYIVLHSLVSQLPVIEHLLTG